MKLWPRVRNALRLNFRTQHARQDSDGMIIPNARIDGRLFKDGGEAGAETIPVAYACVNVMTETMARLPKYAAKMEDPRDDYWDADVEHPVTALLRQPSRDFDSWQFWEWFFRCRYLTGNAYAYIRRQGGRPVELVPAYIDRYVGVGGKVDRPIRLWNQQEGYFSDSMVVSPANLLELHGPGYDGISSPSPVLWAANKALATIGLVLEHNEQAIRRGQLLKQVITSSEVFAGMPAEKRAELKQDLERSYSGALNAGRVPVLPPGFDVTSMAGMTAVDMQLMEVMRWSALDTCRVWNVPPRMVYVADVRTSPRVSSASLESDAESFTRWTVTPEAERAMAQLTAKLLSPEERMMGMGVRVSADRIGVGSWTERVMATDVIVAKAGVLTPNEGRRRLGYPPHPDGDRLLSPTGAPAQGPATDGEPPDMEDEENGDEENEDEME